jgi:hypothetical protein
MIQRVTGTSTSVIWDERDAPPRDRSAPRYARKLLWSEIDWMMAVPIISNEGQSPDWVVMIDSNISLSDFRFCENATEEERIVAAVTELATSIPLIDERAKRLGEEHDQLMRGLR